MFDGLSFGLHVLLRYADQAAFAGDLDNRRSVMRCLQARSAGHSLKAAHEQSNRPAVMLAGGRLEVMSLRKGRSTI